MYQVEKHVYPSCYVFNLYYMLPYKLFEYNIVSYQMHSIYSTLTLDIIRMFFFFWRGASKELKL